MAVTDAQAPSASRPARKPPLSIAVASGKGGVGKTTVAVNVAVALARDGNAVGLLDADIYGPNVPTMMGATQGVRAQDNRLVPIEAFCVQLMSIGFLVPKDQPLIWRGPMLHTAVRQFVHDVDWRELEYLIIDLPPGTGDAQLSLSQSMALTGGVIVTLPQKVSLEDARRGLEMFRTMHVPVLGVVENMTSEVFGSGGGEQLAHQAGVPFLGSIPMDPVVRQAGDAGVPVVISHPDSPAAQALHSLARDLAARASEQRRGPPISIEMMD